MNKIYVYIFLLLLMTVSVSATTVLFASNNMSVYSIDVLDDKIYLTGNLTYYNITHFGYYDIITGEYTNKSALYPTGTITEPFIWSAVASPNDFTLNYDRGAHFISSSYETLCYRLNSYSIHYIYCYRYSQSTNKWVQILNYNGGADVSYGGQQHINGAVNYNMYNVLGIDGTHQIYNTTSGTLLQLAGSGAIILKQNGLSVSSRITGLTNANTLKYIPNITGTVQFTTTGNSGLGGLTLQDGWTDETNFYVISNEPKIYKSIDEGVTFTEVASAECSDIQNLPNVRIMDIDCTDSGNCIIGGAYNTTPTQIPLLYAFNGNDCQQDTELDTQTSYTETLNRTIGSIYFDEDKDRFYFSGLNILGFKTSVYNISSSLNPQCLDENILCNDPFINPSGHLDCHQVNYEYCPSACTNYGNPSDTDYYGSCGAVTCQSTCIYPSGTFNINGFSTCTSATTWATCGDYDTDECLELGEDNSCGTNEYCSTTPENPEATCTPYATTGNEIVYPPFTLKPYITEDTQSWNNANQFYLDNDDSLAVTSRFSFLTSVNNNTYGARICNYNETEVYNEKFSVLPSYTGNCDNVSIDVNEKLFLNCNETLGNAVLTLVTTNGLTFITTTIETDNHTDISIKNTADEDILKYQIENNGGNSYCVNYGNDTAYNFSELFCITDLDNSVHIKLSIDFETNTYTLKYDETTKKYSKPISLLTTSSGIGYMNISTTNLTRIDEINITYSWNYPAYSWGYIDIPAYLPCTYYENTCVNMRSYLSYYSIPAYDNFRDVTVCMSSIGGTGETIILDSEGNQVVISEGIKLLIGLILVLVTMGILFAMGYVAGEPSLGLYSGLGLALFEIIIMSIPAFPLIGGFLPVWVTIIVFLVVLLISVFGGIALANNGKAGGG